MTDLGMLPGQDYCSDPYGINNIGQVVGISYWPGVAYHAFICSGGAMTALGTLPGSSSSSSSKAYGINDNGQVVGEAVTGSMQWHAFLYSNGTMTDIGTLQPDIASVAKGINDSGTVAGTIGAWPDSHAFIYSKGVMTFPDIPFGYTEAVAINNSGQVVGDDQLTGMEHAFLFSNGVATDLGTLGGGYSNAEGINDNGEIVGFSYAAGYDGQQHAFLDLNGEPMQDLHNLISSNSGWTLEDAVGINNNGQIVGYGINPSGQTGVFLLTPTPEPSTIDLLSVGAITLLVFARRRLSAKA
jgi:probable HAF family extracellular repeat protein